MEEVTTTKPPFRNVDFAVRRALRDLSRAVRLQRMHHELHQQENKHTRWHDAMRLFPILTLEGAMRFAGDPAWVSERLPPDPQELALDSARKSGVIEG